MEQHLCLLSLCIALAQVYGEYEESVAVKRQCRSVNSTA